MKSFALALSIASASASLSEVVGFNFDQYFTKVESRPAKPALGSYSYGYGLDLLDTKIPIAFEFSASGDFNFEFYTPFDNSDDGT
jgi:hypothetical protein